MWSFFWGGSFKSLKSHKFNFLLKIKVMLQALASGRKDLEKISKTSNLGPFQTSYGFNNT